MAVKIRLKRLGKIRAPYYRIVIADSRTKRDGRVIEEIGKYHPTEEPSLIEVNSERAQYWLGVGAQPTEQVEAILKLTGDWGKFKGEGSTESTVKTAEPKAEFVADTKKKPVLRPKVEKPAKVEPVAGEAPVGDEAPSAEVADAPAETSDAPAAEAASVDEAPAADAAPEQSEEAPAEDAPAETAAPEAAAEETPAEEGAAPESTEE